MRFRSSDSGIQIVGIFHEAVDDGAVAKAPFQQGINASALSIQYRHGNPRGLAMGFAAIDRDTTEKAMRKARGVLEAYFVQ